MIPQPTMQNRFIFVLNNKETKEELTNITLSTTKIVDDDSHLTISIDFDVKGNVINDYRKFKKDCKNYIASIDILASDSTISSQFKYDELKIIECPVSLLTFDYASQNVMTGILKLKYETRRFLSYDMLNKS